MKFNFKTFIILLALACFIVTFMVCPFFTITKININGNEDFPDEKVLSTIGLTENSKNIFAFNTLKAKKELLQSAYVKDVQFKRELPSTLNINITERSIKGYVPYMDSYLYIDDEGRVLDCQKSFTKVLPVVKGLDFSTFTLGEKLATDNENAFEIVVELSRLMSSNDILDAVVRVDVSNTDEIHLYVRNVNVVFGTFDEAPWKISALNEILQKIDPSIPGTLDISNPEVDPRFEYLT